MNSEYTRSEYKVMKLNQVFQTYIYIYIYIYIQMSVGPFRAVTLHGYMVYFYYIAFAQN